MTLAEKILRRMKHAASLARAQGHVLSSVWTKQTVHGAIVRSKFCVHCWYAVHFWRDYQWGNAIKFECPQRRLNKKEM